MITGTVYLIHLDHPYKHAQHYIGWSRYLPARLRHHRAGTGSKFLRAVNGAGIEYKVVRKWEGKTGFFEQRLKACKNSKTLCPVCSGAVAYNRMKGETEKQ